MKKNPQVTTSPDPQEKSKARVPFFAQKLSQGTLHTISGGDDMLQQESDRKIRQGG
jgi:hypothetical protein